MTKKVFFSFWLLFAVGTVFNSYGQEEKIVNNNSDTTDIGVIINGVKWATRNVDAPGTFAKTPESAGMFYQWNRKIGWNSTNPMINSNGDTTWDETKSTGTTWEKANDPSPKGWRVPTTEEQQSLFDKSKVTNEWTIQNGVTGRIFTDKSTGNSLFLPAAGYRYFFDGILISAGTNRYWSSTANEFIEISACYLVFDEGSVATGDGYLRNFGLSIRAVAE